MCINNTISNTISYYKHCAVSIDTCYSSINAPFSFQLCSFPVTAVTNYHKLNSLKEQKFILEARNQKSLSLEQTQDAD